MVFKCAACGVKYNPKEKKHSFHSLPSADLLRVKWIEFLRACLDNETWTPKTKKVCICSQHFEPTDFEHNGESYHTILKKAAVPSKFDKENHSCGVQKRKHSPKKSPRKPPLFDHQQRLLSPVKKKGRSLFETSSITHQEATQDDLSRQFQPLAGSSQFSLPEEVVPQESDNFLHQDDSKDQDNSSSLDQSHSSNAALDTSLPYSTTSNESFCITEAPSSTPITSKNDYQSQKKKNLQQLLSSMEAEKSCLDRSHPLPIKESVRYSQIKKNIWKIQGQLLNWAIQVIKDDLVESMVTSTESFEFIQAEYLLLKATNKAQEKSIIQREKKIENLELQANILLNSVKAAQSKACKLEEQNDLLRRNNVSAKAESAKLQAELDVKLKDDVADENLKQKYESVLREAREKIKILEKKVSAAKKKEKRDQQIKTNLAKTVKQQKKTIKNLRRSNVLRGRKLETTAEAIKDLRRKKILSDEFAAKLSELPACTRSLLTRISDSPEDSHSKSKKQYDEDLRSFAITLYFYSPAAYEYVRKSFHKCLPHRSTIISWFKEIDGGPGFQGEAWNAIAARAKKAEEAGSKIVACVLLDDIGLKSQVEFDGNRVTGYVDLGEATTQTDSTSQAKFAFNFMLVGLNCRLIMPCGYFFIDSLTGGQRAKLLKDCIIKLEGLGVQVENVTFDGAASNITMAAAMGASVDYVDGMEHSFPNPADKTRRVNVMLDAVHMLKLFRNLLGDKKLIFDADGGRIEWRYITSLHELQTQEGLHFANRLSKSHIEYWKNKMKVKFAAQVLSSSVASGIEFCNKTMHLEDFEGSEATVKFIRMVNDTFDWLNSRNKFGKKCKAALTPENKEKWSQHFEEAEKYFATLRVGENENSQLLVECGRRRGPVGIIACLRSARDIFERLVQGEGSDLKYLLTHKLSQDHLELFFGSIRRRNGCNVNPTCRIYQSSYKRLVVQNEISSSINANVIDQADIKILSVTKSGCSDSGFISDDVCDDDNCDNAPEIVDDIPSIGDNYNTFFSDSGITISLMVEHGYAEMTCSDLVQSSITEYLAGFVVKQLQPLTKCEECSTALSGHSSDISKYKFLQSKTNGSLTIPSNSVVKICKTTESTFRFYKAKNFNGLLKANVPLKIATSLSGDTTIFNELKEHVQCFYEEDNHILDLIKAVSKKYLDVRLYHEIHLQHLEKGVSTRYLDSRQIIHRHQ